jgi:hypothetical protein
VRHLVEALETGSFVQAECAWGGPLADEEQRPASGNNHRLPTVLHGKESNYETHPEVFTRCGFAIP